MKKEVLKAAIDAIAGEDGLCTPETLVTVAADPEHVLHDQFNWDDQAAAHEYRLDQARALIRSVRVDYKVDKRVIRSVAYVRDPAAREKDQGYISIPRLRREPDAARAAIVAEFARAAAHLRRARDLAVVLGHAEDIEDMVLSVTELSDRIDEDRPSA